MIAVTQDLPPLAAYLVALDAAYVAYLEALRRRLRACGERNRLTKKSAAPGPPPRIRLFPFSGVINSDEDIFSNPPPQSTNALGNNG